LDEETNWDELTPRAGLAKRRLRSIVSNVYQARCAELLSDGVDEAVDPFEAEDDVVMMGEMSVSLLPLWCPVKLIISKGIQRLGGGTKAQGVMKAHQRRARVAPVHSMDDLENSPKTPGASPE